MYIASGVGWTLKSYDVVVVIGCWLGLWTLSKADCQERLDMKGRSLQQRSMESNWPFYSFPEGPPCSSILESDAQHMVRLFVEAV